MFLTKKYFMTGAPPNRYHLSCCLGFHDGIDPTINIATTRWNDDPSICGSHYALQIASFLAQTHNNMSMMTDDDDDIHADRTCNCNNKQRQCLVGFVASKADMESPS